MSEKEAFPDELVTPVPFAGFCTAEGWSKMICNNQYASMQVLFAEVLATHRDSVRSNPDNGRRVQVSISRVELIMYAVNKFVEFEAENIDNSKLQAVFEKFLKSGTPAEWLQMFEICANNEININADINIEFMDALGKNIIKGGFFREMAGLMKILISKKESIPDEIISRHLEMLATGFETMADINEISVRIAKKYDLVDV